MYRQHVTALFSVLTLVGVGASALSPGPVAAHVTRAHKATVTEAAAPPPIRLRTFAFGAASGVTRPDSIVVTKQHVYIAYQNATPPTGSPLNSAIVEYDRNGKALRTFTINGRCDGMRWNPYTHTLWATVNEDSYPGLFVIAPKLGYVTRYHFAWPTTHGGGFDDLAFSGGNAFISASNPTLNASGVNVLPAVEKVTLQSNGLAALTPVLYGNALVKDTTTNTLVHINAVDPDSMQVAPNGDVVLVDQGGTELVFIHNPALKN